MRDNQKGFGVVQLTIVIFVIAVIGAAGWLVWYKNNQTKSIAAIDSYAECVAAGNPVMLSYPEQCAAGGKTFTNTDQKVVSSDLAITNDNIISSGQEAATTPAPNSSYEITEWGVRVNLTDADKIIFDVDNKPQNIRGIEGTYVAQPKFKAELLQDKSCTPGLALYRSKQQINDYITTKVGDYYYWVTGGPGACGNTNDDQIKARFIQNFKPENVEAL